MLKSIIAYKRNALGYSCNKIFIWVFSVKDIICVKLFGIISSKNISFAAILLIGTYYAILYEVLCCWLRGKGRKVYRLVGVAAVDLYIRV